jgi:predicted nuclease of predicted toxin-antitoxin system
LRFLVDECCHSAFVVGLRGAGYDVRYAAETDRRATDHDLTALAIAEDRLIITADYDFGELAVRRRQPIPGVVLLAPNEVAKTDQVERLVSIVASSGDALKGVLTIVDRRRVRIRPLSAT